jgi:signal transduction histidine kinase
MRSLIDDLLAYSRAGREIALADVDLGPLVEQVAIGYGDAVQIGPLPVVRGDYRLLQQTFANLLSNAVKFARPDVPPQVSVTADRVDQDAVVTVADNGIGIEPKYRDRVFRIFQRLHGRSEYPGTGIGLAIVRKAAEQLGGRVEVTDSPLGGAAVRLTLPVREGAIDG